MGARPPHSKKLPGLNKFGDITLKWGLTTDTQLFEWRQEIIDGKTTRKTVYIVALDEEGVEQARWQCSNAWPSKMDPPDFTAKGNDVAMNALTLTCEEVKRTK